MSAKIRRTACAALTGTGLAVWAMMPAMALPPLQCQDFVNFAMDISQQHKVHACPGTPLMHLDRERHFKWCLGKNEAQVRADRNAKNAALNTCVDRNSRRP